MAKMKYDYIQGLNFVNACDFIYDPKLPGYDEYYHLKNTADKNKIEAFNGIPTIYAHTHYTKLFFNFIKNINKEIILVTHNCDVNINETLYKLKPTNVIKWYSQNVNFNAGDLFSIPIGLENDQWFPQYQKKNRINEKNNEPKNYINWLYVNHKIRNDERRRSHEMFKNKSWVSVEGRVGFNDFLNKIYNHKFILCPDGNGIDTHRLWECLYSNSIPIVKNGINISFYKDLPICFVNEWENITIDFLEKEFKRLTKIPIGNDKLNFSYWNRSIK